MKKSENFHPPSRKTQLDHKAYYDPDGFGTAGPIEVSYAAEYSASHQHWHETLLGLGIETNRTHMTGSNVGGWTNIGAVDPETCTRSSSATAYYQPVRERSNLVVLTEVLAERIELQQLDGTWVAKGVRFLDTVTGESFSVSAAKEVILCAGSIQSPQLLELSGIGNPDVLSKAGVETKVASPRVGENLQDHIMAASIYEVDPSLPNPDDVKIDPAVAAAARNAYTMSKTGQLTWLANSVCYLSLSQILPPETVTSLATMAGNVDPQDFSERDEIRRQRFDPTSPKLGQIEYFLCVVMVPSPSSHCTWPSRMKSQRKEIPS